MNYTLIPDITIKSVTRTNQFQSFALEHFPCKCQGQNCFKILWNNCSIKCHLVLFHIISCTFHFLSSDRSSIICNSVSPSISQQVINKLQSYLSLIEAYVLSIVNTDFLSSSSFFLSFFFAHCHPLWDTQEADIFLSSYFGIPRKKYPKNMIFLKNIIIF